MLIPSWIEGEKIYYGFLILFAIIFSSIMLLLGARLSSYYNLLSDEYLESGYAITLESINEIASHSNSSYACYIANLDNLYCKDNIAYYGDSYIFLKS